MRHQNGNALFLILIAVALFAALSYAVTQSGRGSGTIDKESAALDAAALTNYSAQLQAAYLRMRTINGCTAQKISFEAAPYTDSNIYTEYPNSFAPSDKSCHFFHPNGGGVTPRTATQLKGSAGMTYTAASSISGVNTAQFIMGLGGISYAECKAINKALNYNAPTFEPNQVPYYSSASHFTGSFGNEGGIVSVNGASAGCILSDGSGTSASNIIGSGTNVYWYFFAIGPQ